MFKWIKLIFAFRFVLFHRIASLETILLFLTWCYLQLIGYSREKHQLDCDEEKLRLNWKQLVVVLCYSICFFIFRHFCLLLRLRFPLSRSLRVHVFVCVNHCVRRIEIAYLS